MKFLILGSSGMAGHTISLYLKEQGHFVVGFCRKSLKHSRAIACRSIIGDAKDTEHVRTVIDNGKFDAVINCIGILNQSAERDKENAAFLNAYFPHYLAAITSGTETQIIHMSTDCVFSGRRGSYAEDDFKDGPSFYDRSKALGELEDNKNITLRNSIVGPDMNPEGIGLLNWFMKQDHSVQGFTKVMWTGLTTLQLAKVMETAAREKAFGLVNMVYDEAISKYDLLKLFNHYLRDNELRIQPSDAIVLDKSLKRTRFELNCSVPDYETMISEMAKWIRDHKYLYSHYNL